MNNDQKIGLSNIVSKLLEDETVLANSFKEPLMSEVSNLENFIISLGNYKNVELDEVKKDELFGEYKGYMKALYENFKVTKYNFTLSEKEFKFLRNQIFRVLKYNRQDNIIALKVRDNFFNLATEAEVYKAGKVETFQISIDDLTLISHLSSKIEIVGMTVDNDNFSAITEKIANVSRVYEYFNMRAEDISEEVTNWFAGLEPEAKIVQQLADDQAVQQES